MSQQALRAQNDYIFSLQVQADKYARLISSVDLRIRSLEDEFKTVSTKMAALRLKRNEGDQRGGGINAVKSKIMSENREIGKLENRLAACRTRESKLVAANADLKKKIDVLRSSRLVSQSVFEKNQKRLREIQRQMQESFKLSTSIMAERDRVIASAHTLSNVNIEEQESFDEIYQNLATIIAREKESADAFRKDALKSESLDPHGEDYVRGNYRIDEEAEMKETLKGLEVSVCSFFG
jgi:chromosome segregation ATPase